MDTGLLLTLLIVVGGVQLVLPLTTAILGSPLQATSTKAPRIVIKLNLNMLALVPNKTRAIWGPVSGRK